MTEVGEERLDGVPVAEVVVGFARDDDLVVGEAALLQFAHDVPADAMRAGAAGDDDVFVASEGVAVGPGLLLIHTRAWTKPPVATAQYLR